MPRYLVEWIQREYKSRAGRDAAAAQRPGRIAFHQTDTEPLSTTLGALSTCLLAGSRAC